jgi:hypothetical protein
VIGGELNVLRPEILAVDEHACSIVTAIRRIAM